MGLLDKLRKATKTIKKYGGTVQKYGQKAQKMSEGMFDVPRFDGSDFFGEPKKRHKRRKR
jgi:hypothetical protein